MDIEAGGKKTRLHL